MASLPFALRDRKFLGAQHFHTHVEVTVGHLRGSGIAKDRKMAKQEAARVLLQKLEGDSRSKFEDAVPTSKRTPTVNNQKKADQMKARFFREVASNISDQSEEQEDKCPSKGKEEEKSSIAEVPVIVSDLVLTRSLKNKHERPGRIGNQTQVQMKIKSPREEVCAAEASVSDPIATRSLKNNYKRPVVNGIGMSKFSRAAGDRLSEANNNWPMPGQELVANDDVKLVDRVKWRLARMEERLSRGKGEVNADLVRRVEKVKEKLWRFKYLTWMKNSQIRPTRSGGESNSPAPPDSLSTRPGSS